MENPNENKIVQNANLIDISEPVEYKESKLLSQDSLPAVCNSNNQGNNNAPNSLENTKKTETELQSKNEKKKNFFNKFTEKLKSPPSESLKNRMLL